MIGMSLVISKPCCPMYNFGTTNNMDLIPRRLSNLHLQGISPSVAITTRMPKHHAHLLSALKDGNGAGSQLPEVSGVVIRNGLLGVGIIATALAYPMEVNAQSISTIRGTFMSIARFYPIPLLLALLAAGHFLGHILYGSAVVLQGKPFSVGDVIEVGSVKGKVIGMGPLTTSLLGAENDSILVSNSLFGTQSIVNSSRAGWHEMVYKFCVQVDEIEKIYLISEEIINMMKSNSNVYLEERQPYCYFSDFQRYCVELTLGCNLKKMCEDELPLVKEDVLVQSAEIIKQHGATIVEDMGK